MHGWLATVKQAVCLDEAGNGKLGAVMNCFLKVALKR